MGLTPQAIVSELDRFIVGQNNAKKAVAVSLRNRYRRKNVDKDFRDEIMPKNILMIGPTGVGKTEIARRLAKLAGAPFIKVEATKFTEVGYVGRDVESIIRDLADISINMEREKARNDVAGKAREAAIARVLDALVGDNSSDETREKFREKILASMMDDTEIEINVEDNGSAGGAAFDIPGMPGASLGVMNLSDIFGKMGPARMKKKKMRVLEALELLTVEESDKLVDQDKITFNALRQVENDAIVFLDEIDKITSRSEGRNSGEVSREGVQRDLLPLIEGTTVVTKHGPVKTDHILFVASGAFHLANPADLLPELQGRLPIRVELSELTKEDLIRILSEPENSLIRQYVELMRTESLELQFSDCAIETIATMAAEFNRDVENLGARRLHTIMEKIVEDISFDVSEMKEGTTIAIDRKFVEEKLNELTAKNDLSKFIL